jgi:hypothetical protein
MYDACEQCRSAALYTEVEQLSGVCDGCADHCEQCGIRIDGLAIECEDCARVSALMHDTDGAAISAALDESRARSV